MDRANSAAVLADDLEWADRCEYWRDWQPKARGRPTKYRYREPLILVGHGIGIRVHRKTLLIQPGLTHYPHQRKEIRYFPGDPNLPDRIIILDASGSITFDAINWMADQKVGFVHLDWKGRVTFAGNAGLSSNPKLVQWQAEIRGNSRGLELNRRIICAKLDASIETIQSIFGATDAAKVAITKIQRLKSKVLELPLKSCKLKLLGFEGVSAANYYRLWHGLPLQWTKLSKRPIPPDWHKVGPRHMAWRSEGNHARHPVNAMLNYGYAVLISQLHTEIVAAGFDPSIGFAHNRKRNRIPLVYDLVEPLRPVADRLILEFARSQVFEPGDFTITNLGGCRLNPQLAKSLTRQVAEISCKDVVGRFLKGTP